MFQMSTSRQYLCTAVLIHHERSLDRGAGVYFVSPFCLARCRGDDYGRRRRRPSAGDQQRVSRGHDRAARRGDVRGELHAAGEERECVHHDSHGGRYRPARRRSTCVPGRRAEPGEGAAGGRRSGVPDGSGGAPLAAGAARGAGKRIRRSHHARRRLRRAERPVADSARHRRRSAVRARRSRYGPEARHRAQQRVDDDQRLVHLRHQGARPGLAGRVRLEWSGPLYHHEQLPGSVRREPFVRRRGSVRGWPGTVRHHDQRKSIRQEDRLAQPRLGRQEPGRVEERATRLDRW